MLPKSKKEVNKGVWFWPENRHKSSNEQISTTSSANKKKVAQKVTGNAVISNFFCSLPTMIYINFPSTPCFFMPNSQVFKLRQMFEKKLSPASKMQKQGKFEYLKYCGKGQKISPYFINVEIQQFLMNSKYLITEFLSNVKTLGAVTKLFQNAKQTKIQL